MKRNEVYFDIGYVTSEQVEVSLLLLSSILCVFTTKLTPESYILTNFNRHLISCGLYFPIALSLKPYPL